MSTHVLFLCDPAMTGTTWLIRSIYRMMVNANPSISIKC